MFVVENNVAPEKIILQGFAVIWMKVLIVKRLKENSMQRISKYLSK